MSLDLNSIFEARAKALLEKTTAVFEALPKPSDDISPKGRRIARALRTLDFAGHKKDVIALIEALEGEEISKITGEMLEPPTLPKGVIVVPFETDDTRGHNYTIGVPIEWPSDVTRASDIHRPDIGTEGNSINSDQVRAATKEEVESFLLAKMTGLWAPPAVVEEAA